MLQSGSDGAGDICAPPDMFVGGREGLVQDPWLDTTVWRGFLDTSEGSKFVCSLTKAVITLPSDRADSRMLASQENFSLVTDLSSSIDTDTAREAASMHSHGPTGLTTCFRGLGFGALTSTMGGLSVAPGVDCPVAFINSFCIL